ncbi:MAG: diol dehydratase small subunit [Fusobacterium gastrosuis]|uniref:diol dehydratase small subunit n=1 Tax=Fusobacterium TaxID=848 RepID=UPI001F4F453C|nr:MULTISPECIES: diol dehydratase small subunit [Fusobacterium]MDD7392159.1 diol dehydratase small subunit [Fusobacteriaceae bacterium]MCI5724511.1 diol dehydratase small subunit [Fusobacterium sp.]MCI7222823.1 diol dehydratase small subunit [Fusobacterium sp.]MDD7410833.1 diol dehydratase small subunit [Fusobacteriaceae bacterium]MDY4011766.1 diol dehydratase small subunit [Fusobacterium gastrosuis]
MEKELLEKLIRDVIGEISNPTSINPVSREGRMTDADYPLSEKKASILKSATGRTLSEFTMENVMSGKIGAADCRIAPETLEYQAQVAESLNRKSFARNLRRAAELIAVPDERILEIYNLLRPYRSTKKELLAVADELENKYNAKVNAQLVREAAELYEKRNRLKED